MEERSEFSSSPALNRTASSSVLGCTVNPRISGTLTRPTMTGPGRPVRPNELKYLPRTPHLRRADSSSSVRAYHGSRSNVYNTAAVDTTSSSASYPSIDKLNLICYTRLNLTPPSSCARHRSASYKHNSSASSSHPTTATGSPVPHNVSSSSGDQHVGSPKLAMLSQVKGYLENLRGSLDSLKDEV